MPSEILGWRFTLDTSAQVARDKADMDPRRAMHCSCMSMTVSGRHTEYMDITNVVLITEHNRLQHVLI